MNLFRFWSSWALDSGLDSVLWSWFRINQGFSQIRILPFHPNKPNGIYYFSTKLPNSSLVEKFSLTTRQKDFISHCVQAPDFKRTSAIRIHDIINSPRGSGSGPNWTRSEGSTNLIYFSSSVPHLFYFNKKGPFLLRGYRYQIPNQQRSDLCKKTVIQEACECEFSQGCGSGSKLNPDSIASADPDSYSES